MSEIDAYNYYKRFGFKNAAYFRIGAAAHPLMDWTCPAHDLKPWEGRLGEYVPHLADDFSISNSELRDAAKFTRETLDMLIGIHDALSGWDW